MSRSLNSYLGIFSAVIILPIFEEIFFRGIIFKQLRNRINIIAAIIIQAVIFLVFHGNPLQGIYACLLAVVLSLQLLWTSSLLSNIITHTCYNLLGVIILPNILSEGNIFLIMYFILGVILSVISIYLIYKGRGITTNKSNYTGEFIVSKINPYEKCPIYETENFILRLVDERDADHLLRCYSDLSAVKMMNSNRCTSNFYYTTIDEMKNRIKFWLEEYAKKAYVRFSIIDKQLQQAVGTIEMFGGSEFGVFRIDLRSDYEKQSLIAELLKISNTHFYELFKVKHIISKAIPEASERLSALIINGFSKFEDNTVLPYDDYYIR